MNRNFLLLTAVLIGLSGCKTSHPTTTIPKVKQEVKPEVAVQEETKLGINVSFMDKRAKPGDDFFRYVNGKWIDNTEIPEDRTSWGSFNELRKSTDHDALEILQEAAVNTAYNSNTDQGKAVNLYKTIMDTIERNQEEISLLKTYLNPLGAIKLFVF